MRSSNLIATVLKVKRSPTTPQRQPGSAMPKAGYAYAKAVPGVAEIDIETAIAIFDTTKAISAIADWKLLTE